MWVRVVGVIMILLGLSFWTGNLGQLIPVHMLLGITIVLALWTLAALGAAARVNLGLVALGFGWGLIVPILGVTQTQLLPGSTHWVIQVLHLLVGLVAIGLADNLARSIKQRRSTDVAAQRATTAGEALQ
jgi:hypothetical protein